MLYSKQFDGVWLFVQKISAFRLELPKWDQKQQFLPLTKTTVAKIKIIVLSIPIAPTTAKKIMRVAFIPPGGGGGVLNKSFIREAPSLGPEVQPLILL